MILKSSYLVESIYIEVLGYKILMRVECINLGFDDSKGGELNG